MALKSGCEGAFKMTARETIPDYRNNDTAPFIFFDQPIAWGTYGGIIQIELGARAMTATHNGEDERPAVTEIHIAARMRCSPVAARKLRDAIDRALVMFDRSQHAAAAAVDRLIA